MTHKLIKTGNYLLVVDESEIKEGDWYFDSTDKVGLNPIYKRSQDLIEEYYGCKKIIAHLPLNNSPILEGVDLLPPLEDEVDLIYENMEDSFYEKYDDTFHYYSFAEGYNTAKKKYKYTDEDIDKAYWAGMKFVGEDKGSYKEFLQSIQQPKYPVGFECEMVNIPVTIYPKYDPTKHSEIPKTTTNSQGLTQLVGTYKYE